MVGVVMLTSKRICTEYGNCFIDGPDGLTTSAIVTKLWEPLRSRISPLGLKGLVEQTESRAVLSQAVRSAGKRQ